MFGTNSFTKRRRSLRQDFVNPWLMKMAKRRAFTDPFESLADGPSISSNGSGAVDDELELVEDPGDGGESTGGLPGDAVPLSEFESEGGVGSLPCLSPAMSVTIQGIMLGPD